MELDDSKLNPYALKLYHLEAPRVLGKFTEVFGSLLDKYKIWSFYLLMASYICHNFIRNFNKFIWVIICFILNKSIQLL